MIIAVPAETPVTLPEPSTETLVLNVLHRPPEAASFNGVEAPVHTVNAPPIEETDGNGFTVIVEVV